MAKVPSGSAHLAGRLRSLANSWFPDRQLLIRGPDRISSVALTQRTQLGAVAAVSFGILWLGAASFGVCLSFGSAAKVIAADQKLDTAQANTKMALARMVAETRMLAAARDQAVANANALRDQVVAEITSRDAAAVAQAQQARATAVARANALALTNETALLAMTTKTQAAIDRVDGILKATGLDPDQMVRAAPVPVPAGAPPAVWSGISPDEQQRDNLLLNNLGRLNALETALTQVPLAAPVSYISVTSPFGFRPDPWTGVREFHVGVDLRGPVGTPVYATAPGVVTYSGGMTGYGNIITIDHGYGLSTRYSHLDRMLVKVGATVTLHEEIGLLGNTGWSTGPHLLYETRVDGQPENPFNFMKVAFDDVQK